MFHRLILIAAISTMLPSMAHADAVWLEKEYDFGLMKEEAGPKTGCVRLVNTGPEPIVITGARPSCGCTGVDYPNDPIEPGDTVKFYFTYNPAGRPGKFAKSIRVYIGEHDMSLIRIRGNVLGTPESLSTFYPVEAGPLRLSGKTLSAGDVAFGTTRHFFINGYNQTADTIRPHWICANPALSVASSEEKVGPGDIVTFSFYFNSRDIKEMGPVETPVCIYADSYDSSPSTEIKFTAKVVPDFSKMTPQEVKDAPQCYLAPPRVDLGEVAAKRNPVSFKFLIRNDGNSDMRMINVYPESPLIKVKRRPSFVKPGHSAEVQASLDVNKLKSGAFNIKIEIMTDDPLHPVRTLPVVGIRQ